MSRTARLTLAFLAGTALVGLGATLYGMLQAEPSFRYPGHAASAAGLVVAVATVGNLLTRFVRWHFLLRRLGVRLPMVPSLGAFGGSFAFLPVPLYLGQILARARLLPAESVDKGGLVIAAAVWERGLDVWAIALLAAIATATPPALVLAVALGVFVLPGVRRAALRATLVVAGFCSRLLFNGGSVVPLEPGLVGPAATLAVWGPCVLLSLGAWGLTLASVVPLAHAAGLSLGPIELMGAVGQAILIGAVSLVPLGAGTSGLSLVRVLEQLGAGSEVVQVAFLFRLATAWLTLGVGGLALLLHLARRTRATPHDHFDAIDECYDAWLPPAYRAHLVDKKTAPILARLGGLSASPRGLDIGCGRGRYLSELQQRGAVMVGVDPSALQLSAARGYLPAGTPLARGSVLRLPFVGQTFDFAYIINVLHHLPSPAHQDQALAEIAAVVRPGGLVFVHEMNVRNPLFRFYLSYVFPILKGIEEGTEHYLDPRTMDGGPRLRLAEVHHFSFLPDFVPAGVLGTLAPLERRLEKSWLAPYSAHFLAVYERVADPGTPPTR